MENLLKTNKHTVCCLGGKQNQQTVIPNLWLSVSLSFGTKKKKLLGTRI